MNLRISVSQKLLLFILPLVCLPIATVGYLTMKASVKRIDRLVRQEQIVKVEAAAQKINDVFYYCRLDMETISSLPILEDYNIARSFRLNAETKFNYDNIVRLFKDFIDRTPYYYQIRYLDHNGTELIKVGRQGEMKKLYKQGNKDFFHHSKKLAGKEIFVSDIVKPATDIGYVIHWARAVFSSWREPSGVIVIDLDFEKILNIVNSIRIGENGYAFMVDQLGRNIAHPRFDPYRYNLNNYSEPSLKDLVIEMMSGSSQWKTYSFEGEEKVAAFAPIPNMNWSLAVSIPVGESQQEVRAIQMQVIQVVGITLILTALGVIVLSYYLLRPIRNLVTATNRISEGDLQQEIPIQSHDELGDLTHSFNRMVKNLFRMQNELVRSEKFIALGKLSAGVAHEVRNPLNAMKGAIVYLQRCRAKDSLIQEYTQLVMEEIDRLNIFVTEFLDFAKQSTPKRVPTNLNKLIVSTQNLFMEQAREMAIHIYNNLEPGLPEILIDPHQIEQVIVNILINAMDAMPSGGEVVFSTLFKKDESLFEKVQFIKIEVQDTGTGIPKDQLPIIFDPFFSTKEAGTGIGLPLSQKIIENHGGRIMANSQEGRGTRISLELPVKPGGQIEMD